jgi:hypothetical protein
MPTARYARALAGCIDALKCCVATLATLNPAHIDSENAASAAMDLNMRAETQSLVEEIKQSLKLLRRHL